MVVLLSCENDNLKGVQLNARDLFQGYYRSAFIQSNKLIVMAQVGKASTKGWRTYLSEVLAGLCSGFTVSPITVVIDKSVIEYTSGQGRLQSLVRKNITKIAKNPRSFLSSFQFKWMYFVYAPTYIASNLADHIDLTTEVSHPIQKLAMVFLVNTTLSLKKDREYAVRYGTSTGRGFPAVSYGLFFVRDIIAMASAFTIPPILGRAIAFEFGLSSKTGERMGQLISPLMIQLIATPIHLLSLDIYNRPGQAFVDRVKYIRGIFKNALLIRMARFLLVYGFGGIINIELRRDLKGEFMHH